jgi:predicted alpha/beta-hydrolase family hydrolase
MVPTLVVQGTRDRFGFPPPSELRSVISVESDHSLRADLGSVEAAVRAWLPRVVGDVADR